jgi:hypothetical protein
LPDPPGHNQEDLSETTPSKTPNDERRDIYTGGQKRAPPTPTPTEWTGWIDRKREMHFQLLMEYKELNGRPQLRNWNLCISIRNMIVKGFKEFKRCKKKHMIKLTK